ncbi:hydroxyisourate hydrolase [Achromobacter xylosoxidans]
MGLTTHVLDTMHGCPAQGMEVALYATQGDDATLIRRFALNHDLPQRPAAIHRAGPEDRHLPAGLRRGRLFQAAGVALPEPNFLNRVSLDFGVAHTDQHYHVPLLVSPWSYSTYRGS